MLADCSLHTTVNAATVALSVRSTGVTQARVSRYTSASASRAPKHVLQRDQRCSSVVVKALRMTYPEVVAVTLV